MENSKTQIIFEKIDDTYNLFNYYTFSLIMDNCGYVNVTNLCESVKDKKGKPKQFKNWTKLDSSKELMNSFSLMDVNNPKELFKIVKHKSNPKLSGTYAHLSLVPHIACWASPIFAAYVSMILNQYVVKEMSQKMTKHKDTPEKVLNLVDELDSDNPSF